MNAPLKAVAGSRKLDAPLQATMREIGREARKSARVLALAPAVQKNRALAAMAKAIRNSRSAILAANAEDLAEAKAHGATPAFLDRLTLDDDRVEAMAVGLEVIRKLKDPVGTVMASWRRPNGLRIERVREPLGVVGVIYESRPNVTADAGALCLKAGNATVLRGGSESFRSTGARRQPGFISATIAAKVRFLTASLRVPGSRFGTSLICTIAALNREAKSMDLIEVAQAEHNGMAFDIKVDDSGRSVRTKYRGSAQRQVCDCGDCGKLPGGSERSDGHPCRLLHLGDNIPQTGWRSQCWQGRHSGRSANYDVRDFVRPSSVVWRNSGICGQTRPIRIWRRCATQKQYFNSRVNLCLPPIICALRS